MFDEDTFGAITVDTGFAQWATGFSGCDGGNPQGSIWFCGIEYGAGPGEVLPGEASVDQPDTVRDDNCGGDRMRFIDKHQFNRKLAKLYAAMIDWQGKSYRDCFRDTAMFAGADAGSDTFKANLYPLGFRNAAGGWTSEHYERTGLPTKELYRGWCQTRRFEAMRSWVQEQFKPNVVVCFGTGFRNDFVMCFDGPSAIFGEDNSERISNRHSMSWRRIRDGDQLLFLLPFLGQGGLMSNADIQTAGQGIARIAREQLGAGWSKTEWA